ncbi:hypothetical protein BKA70DRAFT_508576 [Coprinopsis sp. MPI-PUGE-AT-0042]|nr:hypothetical protein BKA70DRAFT_508576 [Coprinopsis sp. MPI-PUGE-AT-0042]
MNSTDSSSLKRRASGYLTETLPTYVDPPPAPSTPLTGTKRQKRCSEAASRRDIKRPSLAVRSKSTSNSISSYPGAFASIGSTASQQGSSDSFSHSEFRRGPEPPFHRRKRALPSMIALPIAGPSSGSYPMPMGCLIKFLNKGHICSPSDLGSCGRPAARPNRTRAQKPFLPPLRHHVRVLPSLDQRSGWISPEGRDHPRSCPTAVGGQQPRDSSPNRSLSLGNTWPVQIPELLRLYQGERHWSPACESVTAPPAMRLPALRLHIRGSTLEPLPSRMKHAPSPLSSAPSSPLIQTPRAESCPPCANSSALSTRGILASSGDWSRTLNVDESADDKKTSETSQWNTVSTSSLSSHSFSGAPNNREDVPVYWQSGSTPFVLPSEFSELIVHQMTIMGKEEVARVMVAPLKPQRREKIVLEDGEMLKSSVTYPLELLQEAFPGDGSAAAVAFNEIYKTVEPIFHPEVTGLVQCAWCGEHVEFKNLHSHLSEKGGRHELPLGKKDEFIRCLSNIGDAAQPRCTLSTGEGLQGAGFLRHFKDCHVLHKYGSLAPTLDVILTKKKINGLDFGPMQFRTGLRSDATRRNFQLSLAVALQAMQKEGLIPPSPSGFVLNGPRKKVKEGRKPRAKTQGFSKPTLQVVVVP